MKSNRSLTLLLFVLMGASFILTGCPGGEDYSNKPVPTGKPNSRVPTVAPGGMSGTGPTSAPSTGNTTSTN